MPSNGTYVCIFCKTTKRGDMVNYEDQLPLCNCCKKQMEFVGKHWRVPKQNDKKAWDELEIKLKQKKHRLLGI